MGENTLIYSNFGRAISAGTFSRRLSKAARAAGIFETARGLRKYFATNVQAKTIMDWTKEEQRNTYADKVKKEILAAKVAEKYFCRQGAVEHFPHLVFYFPHLLKNIIKTIT